MSTIVAVSKDGESVIGADTLTKYGEQKESSSYIRDYSKVIEVGESLIAFVGHASFGLVLKSYLSKLEAPPALSSKMEIFEMARAFHPVLKKEYHLVANDEDTFEGAEVDCLVLSDSGIYGIYSMQNVHQFSKFYAFGSGSQYALGAMAALYSESDFNARQIASKALEAAAEFDDASAAPFEIKGLSDYRL